MLLAFLIFFFALYFLIKLRFFMVFHPVRIIKKAAAAVLNPVLRRSLFLALAGTIGVGNILGTAIGIAVGGEGVVFWIFLSGIFSSVIKYAERLLSASQNLECGMCPVIKSSFRRFGNGVSKLYALLCLFLAITMGTMLQSNAVFLSFSEFFKVGKVGAALFTLSVFLFIILFFKDKIDSVTAVLIPLATAIFLVFILIIIGENIESLVPTLKRIIDGAFRERALFGGSFCFVNTIALKQGFARGLLSNEAGAGTSSLSGTEKSDDPQLYGVLGILEVFFDTTLICTLVGLAICLTVNNPTRFNTGIDLIYQMIKGSSLSRFSFIVPLLIFLFAISTVICWFYYGKKCLIYLAGRAGGLYLLIFSSSVFLGALVGVGAVVYLCDLLLLILSLITLFTLKKNSERIVFLSEQGDFLK